MSDNTKTEMSMSKVLNGREVLARADLEAENARLQQKVAQLKRVDALGEAMFNVQLRTDLSDLEAENAKLRDVFDELLTNIDHATSCGAWNVQAGSQTHETIEAARAIIAAHTAKLRHGVALPEGLPAMKWQNTMFTREQLQQYGDQSDQAGYLRGLETALLKVTGLSVDVERCKQLQLTTQAWEEALDVAAAAIEKLKGGE